MSQLLNDRKLAEPGDYAQCRQIIKQGSKSFYAASLVLPKAVREPAYGLYAFCRMSDDAVDDEGASLTAVASLRERLDLACQGRPLPMAADRAMADLMQRYAIPRAVPEALLDGLEWDMQGRTYETIEDVYDYAARVAGTVGVMMTLLMNVRLPQALARACDLGVAMQLTNIARDVGEDARNGRLYLPRVWMREAGLDPQGFLDHPVMSPALQGVIERLLAQADGLYERARFGIAHLPLACRPAILAAGYIYAEIGRALETLSYNSIQHRAHVPRQRKAQLLAKAAAATPWLSTDLQSEPLPAVSFLVEAVIQTPAPQKPLTPSLFRPFANLETQFVRVLDIFERLERAEQLSKSR